MAREVTRSIVFYNQVTEFLHHILYNNARPTILIVCSTRDRFLEQLYAAIHTQTDNQGRPESHELLTMSIGMLSKASRVRLAFCPTLEHLRAYISVLPVPSKMGFDEMQRKRPLLTVLDLLALHIPTSEFSAQGLSRTFAATVEVAAHKGMDLALCECQNAIDPASRGYGGGLWDEHVPILNGSIRMGGEEGSWRGRGVPVRRIAERWFEFNASRTGAADI